MSDIQQAPDWWQASDGKWYPPQQAPQQQPQAWGQPAQQPQAWGPPQGQAAPQRPPAVGVPQQPHAGGVPPQPQHFAPGQAPGVPGAPGAPPGAPGYGPSVAPHGGFAPPGAPPGYGVPGGPPGAQTGQPNPLVFGLLASAVILIVAAFLPWGSIGPISISGTDGGDGAITIFLALVAGGMAFVRLRGTAKWPSIVAIVVGVLALLVSIIDILDIADIVGLGSVGIGLWLTALASIGIIATGALTLRS